jgi:hypothetical protein
VPPPTVIEDHQNIAYYFNQSAIYTPFKNEQEEWQTMDKQMLFYPGL